MERFKLLVSLFLAQHQGKLLSEIFGVKFEKEDADCVLDICDNGTHVLVECGNYSPGHPERKWCCIYIQTDGDLGNILEFWFDSLFKDDRVNYHNGLHSCIVDIVSYVSFEDKI